MSINIDGRDENKGILYGRKIQPLFKAKVFEYITCILNILLSCIFILTAIDPKYLSFSEKKVFGDKFLK